MKILLITSFFPPTHTAGTETYTFGIARGLLKAGHQVQVICVGKWNEGERYWNECTDDIYEGVPVRRFNLNWAKAPDPNRYLYDNPRMAEQLQIELEQNRPDVVHITSCLSLSASILQTIKDASIPVILTLTDFWFLCPRITLLRSDGELCDGQTTASECLRCMLKEAKIFRLPSRLLPRSLMDTLLITSSRYPFLSQRRGLRGMAINMGHRKTFLRHALALADYVIAPSSSLKNIFLQNIPNLPIRVLPHGHDLTWLESLSKKPKPGIVRIGYLGQIIPVKGVHLLVEAFKLANISDRATLDIFGDGTKDPAYSDRLCGLAAGCSSIQFKGPFTHSELSQVLGQLDVIVVPSIWYENSPLVIQEAFAAKTPVIAANLGGMAEFVQHETNGLLFQPASVQDLASQLRRIILEPGLLGSLQAGIPPVRRVDQEVADLTKIYRELAKNLEQNGVELSNSLERQI